MGFALRGRVFPAVPVPFDKSGRIDGVLHREYVTWMATQDIGGVAVWAHTGRGLHLSTAEREYVLSEWRAKLKDRDVICGVGVPSSTNLPGRDSGRVLTVLGATTSMAECARAGGADALLVYPPTALRGLPDFNKRVIEYHATVAEIGLPFVAFYLYEAAGGISYDAEVLDAIARLDHFAGIKLATLDSVMTFQDVAGQLSGIDNAIVVSGEDRFLGYSFEMGAEAALIGLAAGVTDTSTALVDSWFARDFSRFHELSVSIDRFARETFCAPMDGYVQRMLWVLEADGVLSHRAYDRHGPELPAGERSAVFDAVLKLRAA